MNLCAARGVAVREFVLQRPHGARTTSSSSTARRSAWSRRRRRARRSPASRGRPRSTRTGCPTRSRAPGGRVAVPLRVDRASRRGSPTGSTPSREPPGLLRSTGPRRWPSWLAEIQRHPLAPTLRHRLRTCRRCSRPGSGRRRSRRSATWSSRSPQDRPRALIQMATGVGKTFTAVNVVYRLIKFAEATARPVPGRPRQPRPADAQGVPAASSRPTTAASSPSCTTSST